METPTGSLVLAFTNTADVYKINPSNPTGWVLAGKKTWTQVNKSFFAQVSSGTIYHIGKTSTDKTYFTRTFDIETGIEGPKVYLDTIFDTRSQLTPIQSDSVVCITSSTTFSPSTQTSTTTAMITTTHEWCNGFPDDIEPNCCKLCSVTDKYCLIIFLFAIRERPKCK